MKAFLDSNIFLRFFVPDNEKAYGDCEALLRMIDRGSIRPYTSPIVLLECDFVLSRQYKFPKDRVQDAVGRIGSMRNITIVSRANGQRALKLWRNLGIKLADCLIATQVGKGITLVTYDREFQKIPGITVAEPADILSAIPAK